MNEKRDKEECQVFDFYSRKYLRAYGKVEGIHVSNITEYKKYSILEGQSPFVWRSGIKHDCAKIMELTMKSSGNYINGLSQEVELEEDLVYPLVKSSDISKNRQSKYLLITQRNPSENTDTIKLFYPKAYAYLLANSTYLDSRKSSIYKNRSRFSIFGVGNYSFSPYKVVISALYQSTYFAILRPIKGKPVLLDDTCYSIAFDDEEFAVITQKVLNSHPVQNFLKSICPLGVKRFITKGLLMRIDIIKAMHILSNYELGITIEQRMRYTKYISSLANNSDIEFHLDNR